MNNHATKQAEFWRSASPAESRNPDFHLPSESRAAKPLTYDTTNFGNAGTNREHGPRYRKVGMGLLERIG